MHILVYICAYIWASLVAQVVKNPPAMWETWVSSLGWEDPLEKERLPTLIFWPGGFHGLYSPWGCKESDMTERLSLFMHVYERHFEICPRCDSVNCAQKEI